MATQALSNKQQLLTGMMLASARIIFDRSPYLRPVILAKLRASKGKRVNWSVESDLKDSVLEVISWAADRYRLATTGKLSADEEAQVLRLWRVGKAGAR